MGKIKFEGNPICAAARHEAALACSSVDRRPIKVAAVALANKIARMAWPPLNA
jgi:hypothetical protein